MRHELAPPLEGFESIKRFWDRNRNLVVAKILPGEFYVTKRDEVISTVLGSCIAACIYDPLMGIGGMNHFMLPSKEVLKESGTGFDTVHCRYGNWAMEYLVNEILKNGGDRSRLRVKIFGGGKVIKTMTDVGERNIKFAMDYIKDEGFEIESQDVSGPWPRKVLFHPESGKAQVKKLRNMHNDTIERRESKYMHDIDEQEEQQTDIELFE